MPRGGVAHEVDNQLFRSGHFGAHGEAQAVAQLGGLAPADEAARGAGLPEGGDLLAGAARLVGDDGVVQVHGVHDFPDDAVGVQGHLVGGQAGQPLVQPFLAGGGNLVGKFPVGGTGLAAGLPLDLFEELVQHQPGVAHHRIVRFVVLVDVAIGIGGVDEGLAWRQGSGKVAFGHAGAHGEYGVGAGEEAVHLTGLAGAADTQGEGMVFGKGALALQGGHNGNLEVFGQFHQFVGGLRVEEALSGGDDGTLG